ncbi:hypothetical protein LR48_Vigan04g157300 [Vigna angularis]|uniref:Uncharacterized protein n=1 Tax=Phaseolus angularis TaxID=3914 RepID=A0A0L9UEM1_PHAAN|nr:hypothetical protein LR48_Vigan04g157300 [Vigna angularis]
MQPVTQPASRNCFSPQHPEIVQFTATRNCSVLSNQKLFSSQQPQQPEIVLVRQEQCQNLQNMKRQTNKSRWTTVDLAQWMDCRSRVAARGGSGAVDEDEDIEGKNGGGSNDGGLADLEQLGDGDLNRWIESDGASSGGGRSGVDLERIWTTTNDGNTVLTRRQQGSNGEAVALVWSVEGSATTMVQGRCSRQASGMEAVAWTHQAKHQRAMEAATMVRETKMKGSDE